MASLTGVVATLALSSCTGHAPADQPAGPSGRTSEPRLGPAPTVTLSPAPEPPPPPPPGPARFRAAKAIADVRLIAGRIGPRLATAPAYRAAGRMVARRLDGLGYDVRRQWFRVPAGDSWGVPVAAGRSFNVVATPVGFDPGRPHLLVGAHLDTVAVAPGAEDNASGVAVLLEAARLAAEQGTRLPVVLVAFGAEEPRGPGEDEHHVGSRHYVRRMPPAQRDALRAMVSLDRVGVGRDVPVCTGPLSPPDVRKALLRDARRVAVRVHPCENTASDHWSFERAGFAVARLGSTSYAEYHSAADLPRVVDPRQLTRTGRLLWAWLERPGQPR